MLSKNTPPAFDPRDFNTALAKLISEIDKQIGMVHHRTRQNTADRIKRAFDNNNGVATNRIPSGMGDIISSDNLNALMQRVFFDIQMMYGRLNRSRNTRRARENVEMRDLREMDTRLRVLKEQLKRFQYLRSYPYHDKALIADFNSGANGYDGKYPASIDADNHRLTLGMRSSRNVGLNASAAFTMVSAGTGVEDSAYGPEFAIDQDPRSYWSYTLLTDTPLTPCDVDLGKTRSPDGTLLSSQTYSEVTGRKIQGAVGYLVLTLPKAKPLNQVKIKPFGKSPLKVIDISYSESEAGEYYQIPFFDTGSATDNKDYLTFQFEVLYVKRIRIMLAQENYDEIFHMVSESQLNKVALLDLSKGLTQAQKEELESEGFHPEKDVLAHRILNEINEILALRSPFSGNNVGDKIAQTVAAVGEAISELDKGVGDNLQTDTPSFVATDTMHEIKKYAYSMGIADVRLLLVSYSEEGNFKSREFVNDIDLFRVQLKTRNEQPVLYDSDGRAYLGTSIEWGIDTGRGRIIPILPVNSVDAYSTPFVKSERLLLQRESLSAVTRWPVDTTKYFEVRANGAIVEDYQVFDDGTKTRVGIAGSVYNPNLIYTVMYYPLIDATNFDPTDVILDNILIASEEPEEVFDGTREDFSVVLNSHPFVNQAIVNDYKNFVRPNKYQGKWYYNGDTGYVLAYDTSAQVARPMSVRETLIGDDYALYEVDGRNWGNGTTVNNRKYEPIIVTVGGQVAENITNYVNGDHPPLMGDKQDSQTYQYIQEGNKLVFSGRIEEEVRVRYRALASHVALIGILRCNRTFSQDLTPIVKEAVLLLSGRAV